MTKKTDKTATHVSVKNNNNNNYPVDHKDEIHTNGPEKNNN